MTQDENQEQRFEMAQIRSRIDDVAISSEATARDINSVIDRDKPADMHGTEAMYEDIMRSSPLENNAAKAALANSLICTLHALREIREKMLRGETDFEVNRTIAPMASNVKRLLDALKMLGVKESEDDI